MKELFENKKILFFVVGFLVIIFIVLGAVMMGGGDGLFNDDQQDITSIEARNNGSDESLTVFKDGRVEIRSGGSIYNDYWTSDKTDAVFAYYNEVYGDSSVVTNGKARFSYDDDELIGAIIGGTTGSGGSGGNTPGQDIGGLFNTPTPNPTGSPLAGGSTPTPTPSSPQGQPWCLYWRLSYCVIAYQTPVPSGGPTASPGANILPPTCPENTLTGRTVIGNELCISE